MIALIQWLRILIALRTKALVSIDEHVVLAISIHVQVRSVGWLVYLAVWLFNRLILPVLIVLHSILVHFVVILIVIMLFFIMMILIHFTLEFLIRGKTQILIIHWIILLSLIDMITARLIDQRQRDLLIVSEIILIRWELLFVLTSGKCFVHVEKLYIMDSWVLHSIQQGVLVVLVIKNGVSGLFKWSSSNLRIVGLNISIMKKDLLVLILSMCVLAVLLKVSLVVVVLSEIAIYILLFLFTKHSNFSLRRLH